MLRQLCRVSEIGEHGKEIALAGEPGPVWIMLFRRADEVRAFLNVCPHQGRSLNLSPDRFLFTPEGWLMCPHHGACFDLADGSCVDGPCRGAALRAVGVKIEEDHVWLTSLGDVRADNAGPAAG